MTVAALSLVLVAAVAHALWNLAAKRAGDGGAVFVWLYYTGGAIVCLPVAIGWLVVTGTEPQWTWLWAAIVTAVLHVIYGVVLQHGYARGDMSVVYPAARGTGPMLAAVVAVLALGERPAPIGLAGAALVVGGVVVIGTSGSGRGDSHARKVGLVYGVTTGVVIACYTLWDAHAVTTLGISPLVYFALGAVLQSAMLGPRALAARQELPALLRRNWKQVTTIAVLSPLAYLLVLYAMRVAPVSLVAPARETSIVVGSLLGILVLREANPGRRLAGSAVVLAGVTLIGLA